MEATQQRTPRPRGTATLLCPSHSPIESWPQPLRTIASSVLELLHAHSGVHAFACLSLLLSLSVSHYEQWRITDRSLRSPRPPSSVLPSLLLLLLLPAAPATSRSPTHPSSHSLVRALPFRVRLRCPFSLRVSRPVLPCVAWLSTPVRGLGQTR